MSGPCVAAVLPHVIRTVVPDDWPHPTASFVTDGVLLLEVTTDAGLIGWGEPSPYGAPLPALLAALRAIDPLIVGADVDALPDVLDSIATEGVHAYGRSAHGAIVAGLSQAAWDLRGHVAGRPTYELLAEAMGTTVPVAGSSIAAYASAGMCFADAPQQAMVEEALALHERGFTAYKLRPATSRVAGSHFDRVAAPPPIDIEELEQRCASIRAAVPDMALMLDLGRRIPDVATAVRLMRDLGPLGLHFLEEPIAGTLEDHRELRRRIDVPIAGGEQFVTADEHERWLQAGALDLIQPDAGLLPVGAVIDLVRRDPARARRALVPHSWTNPVCVAANVHLALAAGASLIEANETFNPMRTGLLEKPYLPEGGRITIDGRPGLGVVVDRAALARFSD